jgi:hypothetical protein
MVDYSSPAEDDAAGASPSHWLTSSRSLSDSRGKGDGACRLRAEAMTIRDDKAEAKTLGEADGQKIDELLKASWGSLTKAVH